MTAFFMLLAVLAGLMYLNQRWQREAPTVETVIESTPATVSVFRVGFDRVTAAVTGETKQAGILRIYALASGTVSRVAAEDGAAVQAGQPIVILSDTFVGRSLADLSALTAEEKLRLERENRPLSRELLELERKIAVAATASDREEELARGNERIEARTLKSDLRLAELEAERARLAAALSRPAALLPGTVEHVFVRTGDYVSPGTLVATVRTQRSAAVVEAMLPVSEALRVDTDQQATLVFGSRTLEASILSVSQDAVADGLAAIRFNLPDGATVPDGTFVSLSVPLRPAATGEPVLIPLAALRETADRRFAMVAENDRAVSRTITLGPIVGNAVTVTDGLKPGDAVLLDRSLVEGDAVAIAE